MDNKIEPMNATSETGEQPRFLALNEKVSQSLLAVRLLLTEAQEEASDRAELIKMCFSYLNFALEDLRKLREGTP